MNLELDTYMVLENNLKKDLLQNLQKRETDIWLQKFAIYSTISEQGNWLPC